MILNSKFLAAGAFALTTALASVPASAGEARSDGRIGATTSQQLDRANVEYSQWRGRGWGGRHYGYRGGYRGNRGAAVAAGVAAGVLGAAAIAASRPAYGYYEPGYAYEPGYVYEPAYAYRSPNPAYYGRDYPNGRTVRGVPDPAGNRN